MAKDPMGGRGKPAQSHADAIGRQLAKIRELERGVEALKEKEALRLFRLIERAGWFEVSVSDDAFVAAMTELVNRHRDGAAGASDPDGRDASGV